jgi:hypothetical protein
MSGCSKLMTIDRIKRITQPMLEMRRITQPTPEMRRITRPMREMRRRAARRLPRRRRSLSVPLERQLEGQLFSLLDIDVAHARLQAIPSIQEYFVVDSRKRWAIFRDVQGLVVAPRDFIGGSVVLASIGYVLDLDPAPIAATTLKSPCVCRRTMRSRIRTSQEKEEDEEEDDFKRDAETELPMTCIDVLQTKRDGRERRLDQSADTFDVVSRRVRRKFRRSGSRSRTDADVVHSIFAQPSRGA